MSTLLRPSNRVGKYQVVVIPCGSEPRPLDTLKGQVRPKGVDAHGWQGDLAPAALGLGRCEDEPLAADLLQCRPHLEPASRSTSRHLSERSSP
jgi:hypothetical protein